MEKTAERSVKMRLTEKKMFEKLVLTNQEAKIIYKFLSTIYDFEGTLNDYDEEDILTDLHDKLYYDKNRFDDPNYICKFDLEKYYE